MSNLLRQIEAILNSRPLTPLSNDPSDLSALTSSHFLIGRPLLSALRPPIADASITRLGRYKRVELLKQHVWQRLNLEYVSMLQLKHKWTVPSINMRPGALVLIKDKALPPLLWFLGQLVEIYPGSDGAVRVAEVKTKKGTLQRGFNNISPLPLSWSQQLQPGQQNTRGPSSQAEGLRGALDAPSAFANSCRQRFTWLRARCNCASLVNLCNNTNSISL